MGHLLIRLFTGIYLLILSSAEDQSFSYTITNDDIVNIINVKFDRIGAIMSGFEQKIDMINSKVESIDERVENVTKEMALAKAKIENGVRPVKCDNSSDELKSNSTAVKYKADIVELSVKLFQSQTTEEFDILRKELERKLENTDVRRNVSSGGSWRVFKNACIKDNEYKKLSGLTIEACKQKCREEGVRVCKSITYHPVTNICHLSALGSHSDAYTSPCYLDGYDLYEYTEKQCPLGYFKPLGSSRCYIGCPDGFFMLPAPSYQCLKFFNGSTLSWDEANNKCLQEGLVMARPYDALTARQYITEKYGAVGVETRAWLGARGNGAHVVWQRGGEKIAPNNAFWWPGHPGAPSTNHCMQLLSDDYHRRTHPGNPYAVHHPCTENRNHNALCALVRD